MTLIVFDISEFDVLQVVISLIRNDSNLVIKNRGSIVEVFWLSSGSVLTLDIICTVTYLLSYCCASYWTHRYLLTTLSRGIHNV